MDDNAASDGTQEDRSTAAPRRTRKLSTESLQARAQRAANTRTHLMMSAARVVGEVGYRDASVQRITAAAGVAAGTFYLHFPSRQALFDKLLPHFGREMLAWVRHRSSPGKGFLELEEIGMKAVVEFLQEHPWFWRVLNEAEVEAPEAWRRHHAEVNRRYVGFLRRVRANGELRDYGPEELGTLAQLLVAARDYIYRSHLTSRQAGEALPPSVLATYRTFIRNGLAGPR